MKAYDEMYYLVSGQVLEIQKDLSLITKKILLVPFLPYAEDNQEIHCPLIGTYADRYWHKFEEIKEINNEHFLIENDVPYKILNYNDVKYNSLDNPSNDLRYTCKRKITYREKIFSWDNPSPYNKVQQMYAIVLNYDEDGIKAFSWDCLSKFIYIREETENLAQAFSEAFNESKAYCTSCNKIEDLDKDNVNFLNFKIKCPRYLSCKKDDYKYELNFNLENAVYEYKDLLSNL